MHFESIVNLAEKIKARSISPVEVVDHMLHQIGKRDGMSKSYVTVTADRARERAKSSEAEIAKDLWRGPLHGVPIGLKDIIYTDFVRTTGST